MLKCTSTHCERSQECRSPSECSGDFRHQTPCEKCGAKDWTSQSTDYATWPGVYEVVCDGCGLFGERIEKEDSRP